MILRSAGQKCSIPKLISSKGVEHWPFPCKNKNITQTMLNCSMYVCDVHFLLIWLLLPKNYTINNLIKVWHWIDQIILRADLEIFNFEICCPKILWQRVYVIIHTGMRYTYKHIQCMYMTSISIYMYMRYIHTYMLHVCNTCNVLHYGYPYRLHVHVQRYRYPVLDFKRVGTARWLK